MPASVCLVLMGVAFGHKGSGGLHEKEGGGWLWLWARVRVREEEILGWRGRAVAVSVQCYLDA